jgi:hypothetical protein
LGASDDDSMSVASVSRYVVLTFIYWFFFFEADLTAGIALVLAPLLSLSLSRRWVMMCTSLLVDGFSFPLLYTASTFPVKMTPEASRALKVPKGMPFIY